MAANEKVSVSCPFAETAAAIDAITAELRELRESGAELTAELVALAERCEASRGH